MAGLLTAAAVGGLISGGSKIIGSMIGGGKRRREQRAAQAEFNRQKAEFQNFQFKNTYAGLENVFEDATVNQQANQFQAAETDRALANSTQAAIASGGAAGGAQAIAQAALQSKQGIAASIAEQESLNQGRMLTQEAKLQADEAAGADVQQTRYYQKNQQLLNMSGDRLGAANKARQDATNMLVSGFGDVGGAVGNMNFSKPA